MKAKFFLAGIVFAIICISGVKAQEYKGAIISQIEEEGEIVKQIDLWEISICANKLLSDEDLVRYAKLIRNVKRVYPYAKLAGIKLAGYNAVLEEMKSEKARKDYMKQAEKEIEEQFGGQIKELTFSQGKVLIKLVDRETGNSSYDLVKDLRGSFRAFFYQTFARVFGFNLKTKYDPQKNSEDEVIERIVRSIELRQI